MYVQAWIYENLITRFWYFLLLIKEEQLHNTYCECFKHTVYIKPIMNVVLTVYRYSLLLSVVIND